MEPNRASSPDEIHDFDEDVKFDHRQASLRSLSTGTSIVSRPNETSPADNDHEPLHSLFDADDIAVEAIYELIDTSVAQSLEAFFNQRLVGYVALTVAGMVSEAICPIVDSRDYAILSQDPVESVLSQLDSRQANRIPHRGSIDNFSKGEIPVRTWRRPSELYYGSPAGGKRLSPPQTPRNVTRGDRYESPASHPSSVCSFKQRKKKGGATNSTTSSTQHLTIVSGTHPPGVVFSTASPEVTAHCSSRKAIALVRNVQRLSMPKTEVEPPSREKSIDSGGSSDEEGSSIDLEGVRISRRDQFSVDMTKIQNSGDDESSREGSVDCNTPVEVVYSIKRNSPGRRGSQIDLLDIRGATQTSICTLPVLGRSPSQDEACEHFVVDPMSQGFHDMMLSPGVKLQAGETTKTGPELPMFATRMRKSTFHQVETLLLSAASRSPSTKELLTETPGKQQQRAFDPHVRDEDEDACRLQATYPSVRIPVDGVPRKASGALFFKRHSKVLRPCAVMSQQPHFHDGSSSCKRPSTSSATCSQHPNGITYAQEESVFREIARQRAFQRKVSTVMSPTRKPITQTNSGRRPTTATVSSPLSRRRLTKPASDTFDKIL